MPAKQDARRCHILFLFLVVSGVSLFGTAAAFGRTWTDVADAETIDCDFPGGNIVVQRIEGDDVYVHQDLRDTSTWWFYWCFRVRGGEARRLTFHFTNKNVFGTRGPAVSTDGGQTWAWLGIESTQDSSFSYQFSKDIPEVRFCFAMPYQESHLQRFLQLHREDPHLSVGELCRTEKGRVVRWLDVGKQDGEPAHRILLTARHHACESMASYVLEGFLQSMLADTDDGRWYQEHVRALVVPMVDKDGVQDGDQGKNRRPHDHNRDYQDEGIYASVAAIKALVPTWSQGRLEAAIDLHCPWIRGPHNEVIYLVGRPEPSLWEQQTVFGQILEQVQQGTLVYRASDNLPFGQAWNTGGNYGGKMSFGMWAAALPHIRLASTIEVPYANAGDRTVDAASARAFGGDLARAMRRYLSARISRATPLVD